MNDEPKVHPSLVPLRDQLAAAALMAIGNNKNLAMNVMDESEFDAVAKRAYQWADAMLRAR